MPTDPAAAQSVVPPPTAAPPPFPPFAKPADVLPLEQTGGFRPPHSNYRWMILTLIFFAITINYIDRMVLGILAPTLREEFRISNTAYGYITAAFGLSYAFGQTVSGRWLDWVGTRLGYAVALASWSVASMLHALARVAWGFGFMRGLLGVTESPAYPAATKTLAEWFPKKERAFAMGVVNAGANVGAVVAPVVVTWLAISWGWQSAFIVTGAIGLVWLAFWIPMYRRPHEHPRVSAKELAYINSDPPEPGGKVRWVTLLARRQSWGFMIGKFMTDPIWSFYLFWLPTFLKDQHKLAPKQIMWSMFVAYLVADVGSIAGGWMSSTLINRGWSVNAGRKLTLLTCALLTVPAVMIPLVSQRWTAVLLVGLVLAAHQGFSSNLYTLVSDTYPRRAVGSVAGLGGTFGYIGYALFGVLTGWILDLTNKNYVPIFIIAACAYVIAFAAIQLLMPRLEPVRFDEEGERGFDVVRPPPAV